MSKENAINQLKIEHFETYGHLLNDDAADFLLRSLNTQFDKILLETNLDTYNELTGMENAPIQK